MRARRGSEEEREERWDERREGGVYTPGCELAAISDWIFHSSYSRL